VVCLGRGWRGACSFSMCPANAEPDIICTKCPSSEVELQADNAVHGVDVLFCEGSETPQKAAFAGRRDLISHGLSPLPLERGECFGRVEAIDLA
jgi:hypothetical protein